MLLNFLKTADAEAQARHVCRREKNPGSTAIRSDFKNNEKTRNKKREIYIFAAMCVLPAMQSRDSLIFNRVVRGNLFGELDE